MVAAFLSVEHRLDKMVGMKDLFVNYQYNVQLTYNELRVPESYLKIVYLRF